MSRKPNPVLLAVEQQQTALRSLSFEIRQHAQDLRFWSRNEAPVMERWADMLDAIEIALGRAIHDKDAGLLSRLWTNALHAVTPLVATAAISGGVTGVTTVAATNWSSAPPAVCARAADAFEIGSNNLTIVYNWNGAASGETQLAETENQHPIENADAPPRGSLRDAATSGTWDGLVDYVSENNLDPLPVDALDRTLNWEHVMDDAERDAIARLIFARLDRGIMLDEAVHMVEQTVQARRVAERQAATD